MKKAVRTRKESKNSVYFRRILNLVFILVGLVAIVSFMTYMQHRYSVMKSNQTASAALDTITETLDSNTEKVETLRLRYHTDNRAVLNDISALLTSEKYASMAQLDDSERSAIMYRLSEAVGESSFLFIIDEAGTILISPKENALEDNLVDNGTLTQEQLERLLHATAEEVEEKPIIGTPAGTQVQAYFYGSQIAPSYYLIYAVDSVELENQFDALRELKSVLTSVVVGNDGFIFAVDTATGTFMHYDDGTTCLDGESYSEAGLTDVALENDYAGEQTINGVTYQCLSRTYSSPFYGEYTVITAVCPSETVFSRDKTAVGLTSITFTLCGLLLLFYASLLQEDPEQLAHYDEHVLSGKDAYRTRHKKQENTIRNISIFRFRGNVVYLKYGIAEKLAPIVAISAILVFAISWNSQTLTEISNGMALSTTTVDQLDALFNTRESSSEIIMNRYQNQYLSKLQLISFILEEDPTILETLNNGTENEGVYTHLNDGLRPVLNEYGKPVHAIANAQALQVHAQNNGLDYLGIFDDQGRTLAVNDDLWYFTLSRNSGDQSHDFLDILSGHTDAVIQNPGLDEQGENMQYIGALYHYYTLTGDGPEAGNFVPSTAYETYRETGSYLSNGVEYTVTMHRGLIEGGIADDTILSIMESTTNNTLMHQVRVGSDGFAVLFDNSPQHVCLWSPYASSIGRTAEELNVPASSFSGTFKGFTRVNGVKYFQTYNFENGYWVATTLPSDTMLAGRNPISIITAIVSTAFFLLIFLLSIFSTEEEENLLEEALEKRINNRSDNGMVKVMMPSGKMKYVRSAAARYTGGAVLWEDMTTDQRLNRVLRIIMSVIVVCILIAVIFCDQIFGVDSSISYIVNGDWEHGINYFALVAFAAVILSVSVAAFLISTFINFIIRNMGARVETVGQLMLSVIRYGAVLFAIFYGLSMLGFSTAGLVTSAGIMSIVVGLGAQSLIGDILSGIFIVFEGAFRVGDIVTVDDFRGSVVDIGLRTTKIENIAGDIKIFNNSSIAGIINMTKKASKAICDIGIDYGSDLKKIERVLKSALPKIGDHNDLIIGHPTYIGVVELGDSAVILRITADCVENDRLMVESYLMRELLLLFTEKEINIPYPQLVVTHADEEKEEQ